MTARSVPADLHEGVETVIAAAPGTCGELFQGTLQGDPCLVSLPIDWWAVVETGMEAGELEEGIPASKGKTCMAVTAAAARWGVPFGGSLCWRRELPVGKGFGSSTADIGAALFALARWTGRQLTAWQTTRWAIEIEPSDSSLLPGLTLLHHRGGRWWQPLGPVPAIKVLVVDTGGHVDTLEFNRRDYRAHARDFGRQHEQIFAVLRTSLASADREGIGWAATQSARLQQTILPKPNFEVWLELAERTGALGLNVAHSGTLIGLLFPAEDGVEAIEEHLEEQKPGGVILGWFDCVDGGVRTWMPTIET